MNELTNEYYNRTAAKYEDLHGSEDEHLIALRKGLAYLPAANSLLDVGCGTGRGLGEVRKINPAMDLHGLDPSEGLLEIARQKIPGATLHLGAGDNLPFDAGSFDVVTATGIMHHVGNPEVIIAEMFRVARIGVIVSDHNNYAFGSFRAKRLRMLLRSLGLLGAATFVKQGFRRQGYSEEDGWWYPYSLLDNYSDFATRSTDVLILPTRAANGSDGFVFDQSHLAVVGIK